MSDAPPPEAPTAPDPLPPARAGVGTWLFAGLAVLLSAVLLYLTVPACGVSLFGHTLRFPWCDPRFVALEALQEAEARNEALENQVHDAELALLDPALCVAPPVDEALICPPDQAPQTPSQVAIIVDGSGSMRFAAEMPEGLLQRYSESRRAFKEARDRGDDRAASRHSREYLEMERQMERIAGPSRMEVAQDILRQTVMDSPDDLPISMTVFEGCDAVTTRNYGTGNRGGMLDRIGRLRPDAGTPLARALEQAARNLDGANDPDNPVTMVLITDGDDSCGGDPCAAARAIKARNPGLVIDVLDMSQTDEVRCVAEATGGTFRRGDGTAENLLEELQQATGNRGAQCRPAGD